MKKNITAMLILIFMLVSLPVHSEEDQVSKAAELISNGLYDQAIAMLLKEIKQTPDNADAYITIAQAYHWKKDFNKAYENYRRAAEYNPEYKTEIIPLLDELGKWQEIIIIVTPLINGGEKEPSLLGATLTAYFQTSQKEEAARILQILKGADYKEQWQKDYRNYILAYWYLHIDDPAVAKKHLKEITDPGYRKYARTSPKFKKLYNDPEFIDITK